jgi:hypothetical protein
LSLGIRTVQDCRCELRVDQVWQSLVHELQNGGGDAIQEAIRIRARGLAVIARAIAGHWFGGGRGVEREKPPARPIGAARVRRRAADAHA